MAAVAQAVTAPAGKLQRLRFGLMVVVPAVVIIAGLCIYFLGGRYETTDDAYTQAAAVSVSSNISGRVVEIDVHDNQFVKRGATLFRLDDRPLRISVSEAAARLASAKLKVVSLKSTYRQRQADLRAAEESMAYEQSEYARHERLLKSGIVSRAQYDQASHALDTARQQVAGARQQLAAIAAELAENPDIDPDRHPDVQEAQAALDRANLNLSYTVILAPSDGVVTKVEMLQVGDYINAATPLFSLVSNQDVWIEANFKEAQLAGMRVGQSATIKIDRYPDKHFTAVVASMSPSTGSQFSMLPPENASGNWVKVVQRIPVRLHLANADPSIFLQAGLSADVSVDTHSSADSTRVSDHSALLGATSQ
jgi:membrane fusion protein (multidrug efflux system)